MYAVIEAGAKQYRVSANDRIRIEKIEKNIGDTVTFDKVMLVSNEGTVTVGTPYLTNVSVVGSVVMQDRAKKIIVFKKKKRKGYKKTAGHRQYFTEVKITDITGV